MFCEVPLCALLAGRGGRTMVVAELRNVLLRYLEAHDRASSPNRTLASVLLSGTKLSMLAHWALGP